MSGFVDRQWIDRQGVDRMSVSMIYLLVLLPLLLFPPELLVALGGGSGAQQEGKGPPTPHRPTDRSIMIVRD